MRQEFAHTIAAGQTPAMAPARRKPPEKRRDEKIVVMMTAAEKELVQAAADKAELELSQWVRQVLLPAARAVVAE